MIQTRCLTGACRCRCWFWQTYITGRPLWPTATSKQQPIMVELLIRRLTSNPVLMKKDASDDDQKKSSQVRLPASVHVTRLRSKVEVIEPPTDTRKVIESKLKLPPRRGTVRDTLDTPKRPADYIRLVKERFKYMVRFVTGQVLLDWYRNTPEHRRANLAISWFIRQFLFFSALGAVYLTWSLSRWSRHPLTGRTYIDAIQPTLIVKMQEDRFDQLWSEYALHAVTSDHPLHQRVSRVWQRLVDANMDIEGVGDVMWVVNVLDAGQPDQVFICPSNGQIVVFGRLVRECEDDNQLAYILAHELAHNLCQHLRELTKLTHGLWESFYVTVLHDYWSFMMNSNVPRNEMEWLENRFSRTSRKALVYKRLYEDEADRIGLQLMTRACFDVRQAKTFWERRLDKTKVEGVPVNDQLITVHQSFGRERIDELDLILGGYIELMKECGCEVK